VPVPKSVQEAAAGGSPSWKTFGGKETRQRGSRAETARATARGGKAREVETPARGDLLRYVSAVRAKGGWVEVYNQLQALGFSPEDIRAIRDEVVK
jgi:hypothetical protein